MRKNTKTLEDWKKEWQKSDDLKELKNSMDHIDELYERIRNSIGRILMSAEMIEIQEIIDEKIEELSSKDKVAA